MSSNVQGPVFVTGATGFVGRHLVRRLEQQGREVRALVRQPGNTRAFGPTTKIVLGDLTCPKTYVGALEGVAAVVHAAVTKDLSLYEEATAALQRASASASVSRFVHFSSIAVYGNPSEGVVTEATPPLNTSDVYSRTKLAVETAVLSQSGIPQITILRLGCIYGPGGGWWTDGLLGLMANSRLILVNGGEGIANLVHVGDVAAMTCDVLRSTNNKSGIYNVTDGKPISWKEYFAELEQVLGRRATVRMSQDQARSYGNRWLRPSIFRRGIAKIQGCGFVRPLDGVAIDRYASRAVYTNEKAVRLLQFRPVYTLRSDLCRTMAATELL